MKNISLNINPNAITSLAPPPMPAAPFVQALKLKQTYSIAFGVQFEDEAECLKFANKLLNMTNGDAS